MRTSAYSWLTGEDDYVPDANIFGVPMRDVAIWHCDTMTGSDLVAEMIEMANDFASAADRIIRRSACSRDVHRTETPVANLLPESEGIKELIEFGLCHAYCGRSCQC